MIHRKGTTRERKDKAVTPRGVERACDRMGTASNEAAPAGNGGLTNVTTEESTMARTRVPRPQPAEYHFELAVAEDVQVGTSTGRNVRTVTYACPHCHGRHTHGWPLEEPTVGWRSAHCPQWSGQVYILTPDHMTSAEHLALSIWGHREGRDPATVQWECRSALMGLDIEFILKMREVA